MLEEELELQQDEQPDDLYEKKTYVIDGGQAPLRIDKWLAARIEGGTRNKIQQNIEAGFLTVNGKTVKTNYKVKPGDELILLRYLNPETSTVVPEKMELDIVYEDDDVMVINKPPNMVVHPGVGNYKGTLLNGVAHHLLSINPNITEDSLPRFGLVHRIDKNTTGLIVLAKSAVAASHLAKQFAAHTVKRKYTALVWGDVEESEGTIRTNIARHKRFRKMFDAYEDTETGKHAVTHFKVLERMNYVSLVECVLETGRTHQIRVHMKYIGHTLFNDAEYGGDRILKGTIFTKYKQFVDNCFATCPRVALHAGLLGFIHPVSGKEILLTQPLPDDIKNVIDKWRNYVGHKAHE